MKSTKFHIIMIVLHDFAGVSHNISALKTNPLWPERAQGIGRFYLQGRFMKLRKVLAVILLSLVVFAFPSCDFLSGMFENNSGPSVEGDDSNALFGYPSAVSSRNTQLIEREAYTLLYSYDDLIPLWVSWHIDSGDLGEGRKDAFDKDPLVPDEYAVDENDYKNSGFNRGHMCPNADRSVTVALADQTFYMSNMVPQNPNNNKGNWGNFEEYLRDLVKDGHDEVYIIAGPAGTGGYNEDDKFFNAIEADVGGETKEIRVPEYVWKVALVIDEGNNDLQRIEEGIPDAIAVIMPNKNLSGTSWENYICTVDDVESLTGYDFFSELSDSTEKLVESQKYQNFH